MRCQKGAVIVKVELVNVRNREAALVAPAYRRVARHLKIKQGQGQRFRAAHYQDKRYHKNDHESKGSNKINRTEQ